MSIVLQSSGGGSVTIAEPSTASNVTVTIPAATGTVMVSGNMPAFSATADGTQSTANNTYSKILFANETFDTNSNFASSTFTPTVAGYYQLNSYINLMTGSGTGESLVIIRKNGSTILVGQDTLSNNYGKGIAGLAYANGTTDYFEVYQYQSSGGSITVNTTAFFSGFLARSA
jgi:hypothetical protein